MGMSPFNAFEKREWDIVFKHVPLLEKVFTQAREGVAVLRGNPTTGKSVLVEALGYRPDIYTDAPLWSEEFDVLDTDWLFPGVFNSENDTTLSFPDAWAAHRASPDVERDRIQELVRERTRGIIRDYVDDDLPLLVVTNLGQIGTNYHFYRDKDVMIEELVKRGGNVRTVEDAREMTERWRFGPEDVPGVVAVKLGLDEYIMPHIPHIRMHAIEEQVNAEPALSDQEFVKLRDEYDSLGQSLFGASHKPLTR